MQLLSTPLEIHLSPLSWTLGLFCLWQAYRYFTYHKSSINRLPGPKASTWLLGSLVDFYSMSYPDSVSVQWSRTYGSVVRFKGFLGRDHIQIEDPAAVAHLLSGGNYLYDKETSEKPRFAAMFGEGLLSTVGETHRRLRRIMLPAFGTQQINSLGYIFEKSAEDVRDRWVQQIRASEEGWTYLNLTMDCSFSLLNAIGEAAFGYDFDVFNKGPTTPLFGALSYLMSISNARTYRQLLLEAIVDKFPGWILKLVFALPIESGKQLKHQLDIMKSTSRDLFEAGVQDAKLDESVRKDLLSVLVKANLHATPKTQLSAEEVQAQLMTFIMAGWGTVLSVQSGFLGQMVQHPALQQKLREELLELGDHPSVDQLQRAEYLDACLKEAVRLVDVTPLERLASVDDFIPLSRGVQLTDGTTIFSLEVKKGQSFSIPIQALNLDEERFGKDAREFKPDRWLDVSGDRLCKYAGFGPGCWNGMVNFGGGTRSCLGNKFAMLELKIYAHRLLTTFDFTHGANPWQPKATLLAERGL